VHHFFLPRRRGHEAGNPTGQNEVLEARPYSALQEAASFASAAGENRLTVSERTFHAVVQEEKHSGVLELRVVWVVRSNYIARVHSDHTGFEVMLGDMATFTAPEETAKMARPFWNGEPSF
jgi:hypothetical protein